MKIEGIVQRALDEIPVPYQIVKKTDHYYLVVEGYPRIMVGGNHGRIPPTMHKKTVSQIRKLIKQIGETNANGS